MTSSFLDDIIKLVIFLLDFYGNTTIEVYFMPERIITNKIEWYTEFLYARNLCSRDALGLKAKRGARRYGILYTNRVRQLIKDFKNL